MTVLFANNATTALTSGITAIATAITVDDPSVFPAITSPDITYLTMIQGSNLEVIKVTDITGSVLTVVRAQDNTAGFAFSAGSAIELRVTNGLLTAALAERQPLATVLTNTTASYTTAEESKLAAIEASATADQSAAEILTAIKTVDGSGTGLDADLLDGNEATAFATSAQGALADSALQSETSHADVLVDADIGGSVQGYDADTTKNDVANTFTKTQSGSITALTSTAASIAVDATLNNHFSHTFTENTTLANPTGLVAGTSGSFFLTQHASAPKTLAFGSYYKFPAGTAPTVTATNSAVDRIDYIVRSATLIDCVWTGAIA